MNPMRKYLMLVAVFCLLIGAMLVVTACGGGNDTSADETTTSAAETTAVETTAADAKVTYTVVVVDQNGNGVEGVEVQICEGGTCKKPNVTDAEGKVSFSFIPAGGALEVQVNGENSISGYVYPTEKIAVPEGETTITVTIEALSAISVSASGLFGEKFADMVVSLYDARTDALVEQKTTGENGLVSFSAPQGYYYITITHRYGNPAFVFTNGDEEGSNKKTIDQGMTRFEATIVVSPAEIEYKVTVKSGADGALLVGKTVALYNENGLRVSEAVTDQNGVAALSAVNGNYYAALVDSDKAYNVISFTKNREAEGEILLLNETIGDAKETAIALFSLESGSLKAGETLWFTLMNGYKKQLVIESSSLKVTYNGKTYSPVDGVITVDFTEKEGEKASFTLETLKTVGEDTFVLSVCVPGSFDFPIALDPDTVNGQKLSVTLAENEVIYYSFVASEDGTVSVQTTGTNAYVFINDRQNKAVVRKGELVTISFASYDESGSAPAAGYEATLTYGKAYVDYTVRAMIDGDAVSGVTLILVKWNGTAYVEVARATTGADGKAVFASQLETPDYYIKALYDQYETFEEYVLLDEISIDLYLYHEEDGSYDYPISVTTNADGNFVDLTVSLPTGGTLWYSALVPSDVTLKLDNKAFTVKVYLDTNGNWIPDKEDTPITLQWDDAAGAYVYTFTSEGVNRIQCLVEVSGKAGESGTLSLSSASSGEEGSSLASAIVVDRAESFTVTLDETGERFYVYETEGAGKATLSLTGEGGTLKIWTQTLAGATYQTVSGRYEESVIAGSWIYFSVAGEAGTYTVTITFAAS